MKKLLLACSLCIATMVQTTANAQAQSPTTAIEKLPHWFNAFQHPNPMSIMMDSIHAEYPSLLKQVRFLNSLKGKHVKIDFVGMIHYGGRANTDPRVTPCQIAVENVVENPRYYAFICEEGFTVKGRLTLDRVYADEMQKLYLENQIYNIPLADRATVNKFEMFNEVRDKNFGVNMMLKNEKEPFLIGGEDRWLSLTSSRLLAFLTTHRASLTFAETNDIQALLMTLKQCRSEIATAIAAQYLLKMKTKKKAVVVFGFKHIEDFKDISARYGIDASFILPAGCN